MVNQTAIVIAHGVLGVLAWVVFFPLGSVLVRVLDTPSAWKIHGIIQLFAMAIFTAAIGTGIQMATKFHKLDNYHVIIGLLIFGLMWFQAVGGYLHHVMFKKYLRRTLVSHVHLWLGRIMVTLGIINGGLGLLLNRRATQSEIIAYGTLAGIIWLAYVITSAVCEAQKGDGSSTTAKDQRMLARERRMDERDARTKLAREKETMA